MVWYYSVIQQKHHIMLTALADTELVGYTLLCM